MQHNVLDTVLQAFSRVSVGHSSPTVAGLWVTPLIGALPRTPQAGPTAGSALRWAEAHPPHPRRLRARNGSSAPVHVDAGTLVVGGMSTRAVRTTTTVAPDGWVTVAVEPLGARWWDEGAPRWIGRLGPVGAALLLQAVLGESAVASSARTAIWSLSLLDLIASGGPVVEGAAIGWVLSDGNGALAAWLADGRHAPRPAESTPAGARRVHEIVQSLRTGIRSNILVAHVFEHADSGPDVAVLPQGLQLVDYVVAARANEP
jgi:hypothetical protein